MIRPIDRMRRWWHGADEESAATSPDRTEFAAAPPGVDAAVGGRLAEIAPVPAPIGAPPAVVQSAAEHAAKPQAARKRKNNKPREPWLDLLEQAGIPRTLRYPSTTLARLLDQTAERFGDAPAIAYGELRWNYRELLSHVNRTAGGLSALGVRRGDRVLLSLPNCPEFVTTFFAIQKLGAIVVNAGPIMGVDDMRQVLSLTTPRVAIGLDLAAGHLCEAGDVSTVEHFVWVSLQSYQGVFKRLGYQIKLWTARNGHAAAAQHHELAEMLANAPARPPSVAPDPMKTAVLQPTGGTTGILKLAELTHHGLISNATAAGVWMRCRIGQEKILSVLPMFHVYGLTTCLLTGVYIGAQLILTTRFNPDETLALLREHQPTVFPLVPAICEALSTRIEKEKPDDREPLGVKLCMSGAAPLPKPTAERFSRLTGAEVFEGYGLTEASPVTHCNVPGHSRAGSIGLPLPDTRCRIADLEDSTIDVPQGEPGELLIAGPQIMRGYWANPEATARALWRDAEGTVWLRTGDVARIDADGFYSIVDRHKDMIIRSGLKVWPNKVEKVLRGHARVTDVAVVGRADPVHTESVVAVVVLKDGLPEKMAPLVDELRALCREHLAPYEVPEVFEFVAALPRNPIGKLLRRELRKLPDAASNGNGNGNAKGNGNGNGHAAAAKAGEVR